MGLGYSGKFRSTKLSYADQTGTALTQRKRITQLGLLVANTHHNGLQFGRAFNDLFSMEQNLDAGTVPEGTVYRERDMQMIGFMGQYSTDERLCLQADAPRPCTVLGVVVGMETLDV